MIPLPPDRILGVETEFGTYVEGNHFDQPEAAVEALKDAVFYDLKLGLIDLHARDEMFEPRLKGGFLTNGGRLYIDAVGTHLEYATPEVRSIRDLIRFNRAGQRIIRRAIKLLGMEDEIDVYNNSVDHFGGHTFGCHENYLAWMEDDYFTTRVAYLIPFLVTRQIFAGAGRVGGHVLYTDGSGPSHDQMSQHPEDYIWVSQVYEVEPDPDVEFQISQRADHLLKPVAGRVRFNRALINPKWEHFYSMDRAHRLHLLLGEANQSQYAEALKVGSTRLVMRMIEDDSEPDGILMPRPMHELREVSRDLTLTHRCELLGETTATALEIQFRYLESAQGYRGESEETDWILDEWESTLHGLSTDIPSMRDRIDWVAKYTMVNQVREENGWSWSEDALQSYDLEYHNIDPNRSLAGALEQMGELRTIVGEVEVAEAETTPPDNTRAKSRGEFVRKTLQNPKRKVYMIDWNAIVTGPHGVVEMQDPFATYDDDIENSLKKLPE